MENSRRSALHEMNFAKRAFVDVFDVLLAQALAGARDKKFPDERSEVQIQSVTAWARAMGRMNGNEEGTVWVLMKLGVQ